MPNKKDGNWFKRHKILTAIGAFILIVILINATSGDKNKTTSSTAPKQSTATTAKKQVSQSAAENYCEDANLLGKYIDTSTTSIVTLSYHPYYTDSGDFDKAGNPIWALQWDGKDKQSGDKVLFVCQVSGSSDKKIELHSLAINGTAVYGPSGIYDSHGKAVQ